MTSTFFKWKMVNKKTHWLFHNCRGKIKQTLSVVLKELEAVGILQKVVIRNKPLHIEYYLTENGISLIPFFKQLESLS